MKRSTIAILSIILTAMTLSCQPMNRTADISDRVYALALQGDVKQAIAVLDSIPPRDLTKDLKKLRDDSHKRFIEGVDPEPPAGSDSGAVGLLRIFQGYWRNALMKTAPDSILEERLLADVSAYLKQQYPPAATLSVKKIQERIEPLYLGYLKSRGYHSTEPGKTGTLYDLLVWREEETKDYRIELPGGLQNVRVVFMDKFLTLGWEEFATFGTSYPGGWTKPNALYCVKAAYDTSSEDFRVSYLTHEAQHFADNACYPKLQQPDLEYRAKLAELSKTNEMKDRLIKRFIVNALDDSTQAHSFADHCLVRDLSRKVFSQEYVADPARWEKIKAPVINMAARELLKANSAALDQIKGVERLIR